MTDTWNSNMTNQPRKRPSKILSRGRHNFVQTIASPTRKRRLLHQFAFEGSRQIKAELHRPIVVQTAMKARAKEIGDGVRNAL
jgi:hypothetical protein